MGPNEIATLFIPLNCIANNKMVITDVIIIIVFRPIFSKPGISFNPSTADRILIAGVITPSPINNETPIYPRKEMKATLLPFFKVEISISFKTIIPPSPRMLKLIANQAYWIVTKEINVQNIRERTPKIFSFEGVVKVNIIVSV